MGLIDESERDLLDAEATRKAANQIKSGAGRVVLPPVGSRVGRATDPKPSRKAKRGR
jgi:hypothetical protein